MLVSVGLGIKNLKINPGFGKYYLPLPYTQNTYGATLKDDFSHNKRCLFTSNDFTRF
jgi:hypothetical protein